MIIAIFIMLCACISMEFVLSEEILPFNLFEQEESNQDHSKWREVDVVRPRGNRARGPSFRSLPVGQIWPGGVIPYMFHDSVISEEMKALVNESIAIFENYTCLRWKPKSEEDKGWVQFSYVPSLGGCGSAYVGMWKNKATEIRIHPTCVNKFTIMHEMMHAIGFEHEHQRPDRDIFMDMMYHNMEYARDELEVVDYNRPILDLPYDPNGLLHYHLNSISHLGHGRFPMLGKDPCIVVGFQSSGPQLLSRLDIMKINKYYQCDDIHNISGTPQPVYYDLNRIWTNGTFQYQCFMEGDRVVPKAIACFDNEKLIKYEKGEIFSIGEYNCRCDINNDVKESKITILTGCDNFTYTEWIMGRYVYNYECDSSNKQLNQKIVGCAIPVHWDNHDRYPPYKAKGIVRHGQQMEKGNAPKDRVYYCRIFQNGTKARLETNWKEE